MLLCSSNVVGPWEGAVGHARTSRGRRRWCGARYVQSCLLPWPARLLPAGRTSLFLVCSFFNFLPSTPHPLQQRQQRMIYPAQPIPGGLSSIQIPRKGPQRTTVTLNDEFLLRQGNGYWTATVICLNHSFTIVPVRISCVFGVVCSPFIPLYPYGIHSDKDKPGQPPPCRPLTSYRLPLGRLPEDTKLQRSREIIAVKIFVDSSRKACSHNRKSSDTRNFANEAENCSLSILNYAITSSQLLFSGTVPVVLAIGADENGLT